MNLQRAATARIRQQFVRSITAVVAIACMSMTSAKEAEATPAAVNQQKALSRRAELVEANILAVHAYQILLARKAGGAALNACYPATSPDTATLENLVKHQQSLLAEPTDQVVRWADSKSSPFDPARDLQPLLDAKLTLSESLPVNVFTRYLEAKAPGQPERRSAPWPISIRPCSR